MSRLMTKAMTLCGTWRHRFESDGSLVLLRNGQSVHVCRLSEPGSADEQRRKLAAFVTDVVHGSLVSGGLGPQEMASMLSMAAGVLLHLSTSDVVGPPAAS